MSPTELLYKDGNSDLDKFPHKVNHIHREAVNLAPLKEIILDVPEGFVDGLNKASELIVPNHLRAVKPCHQP